MHVASIAYHALKASHRGEIVRLREEGKFDEISCIVRRVVYASFVHAKPSLSLLPGPDLCDF